MRYGYMLHLLDYDAHPLSLMQQAILDLGDAMTEPGLFAQRWDQHDPALHIIQVALNAVKESQKLIDPGQAARLAGFLPEVGTTTFSDIEEFAASCVEVALRPQALALRDLGAGVQQGANVALVQLLTTIEQMADDLRPLMDIVGGAVLVTGRVIAPYCH